jgi:hypothetical protein
VKTTITINGQTYSHIEQMPPEVRRQYEAAMGMLADKDRNGIPDILEGKDAPPPPDGGNPATRNFVAKFETTRIRVNGQEYSRWEDVPQAVRDSIEKARAASGPMEIFQTAAPTARRAAIPTRPAPADDGLRIGLPWLVLLLLVAVLAGFLIALKLR